MCCERKLRPFRFILTMVTVIIYMGVVAIDWYTFADFLKHQAEIDIDDTDRKLTIAIGIVAGVASILLIVEFRNLVAGARLYCCGKSDDEVDDAERNLDRWQEMTSLLEVVMDNAAMTVLIYWGFREGSCLLYNSVYQDNFTANLALIAAVSNATWKGVMSLFFCLCGRCQGEECGCRLCCCMVRWTRSIIATGVMGFGAYLLFTLNDIGFEDPGCMLGR